jgi:hypothetical protein
VLLVYGKIVVYITPLLFLAAAIAGQIFYV